MEPRAKGELGAGSRRSEVQAKSAKGRLGPGAAGGPRRAARRAPSAPPRAHSALPSPPTFSGPGTRLRPGAAE